jgi:hypothetical protein
MTFEDWKAIAKNQDIHHMFDGIISFRYENQLILLIVQRAYTRLSLFLTQQIKSLSVPNLIAASKSLTG